MFKISPKELQDILFEELPDVLDSSDVSDDDEDLEVSTSIDKLLINNFDKTFNSLLDNHNENNALPDNEEHNNEVVNEEVVFELPDDRPRPNNNDGHEVLYKTDEGSSREPSSSEPVDGENYIIPGPSKSKKKSKSIRKNDSLPDKNLKRKGSKPKTGEGTGANKQKSSKRQIEERARAWKKKETHIPDTPYNISEGVVESIFSDCKSATDVFLKLFDKDMVENITYQTNLYATQQGKNLNLKENELLVFLGVNFVMGYHILPSLRDYWSTSEDLRVPIIADAMTRDRFVAILSKLHINDNSLIDPNKPNKLYKLHPLIEKLNTKFKNVYHGTREVSVDESMIRFKGRSTLKQYNPMKPIKRGYKLWCVADQRGYILKFKVYEGKDEKLEEEFKDFGLGERVVLSLTKDFWGTGRVVIFDNYFSSVKLMERLKSEQILACATIRSDRMAVPSNFIPDKSMERGESDYRFSNLDIGCFKWMDNKSVFFISNYHGGEETTIKRKQSDGTTKTYSCQKVVKDYNTFMGGVDKADHLRSLYPVDRKSRKWWHRLFWGFMDITFVNAYVIYCQLFGNISVLEFRRNVSQGLISLKSNSAPKKRSLNSPQCNQPDKKRRKQDFSVSKDVRESNRGIHWPTFVECRGRCEVCSKKQIQSRPHSKCSHCKVFLCVNEKKNCFVEYHGIE